MPQDTGKQQQQPKQAEQGKVLVIVFGVLVGIALLVLIYFLLKYCDAGQWCSNCCCKSESQPPPEAKLLQPPFRAMSGRPGRKAKSQTKSKARSKATSKAKGKGKSRVAKSKRRASSLPLCDGQSKTCNPDPGSLRQIISYPRSSAKCSVCSEPPEERPSLGSTTVFAKRQQSVETAATGDDIMWFQV